MREARVARTDAGLVPEGEGWFIKYPADPVAARHGASVATDAGHAREAYAQWPHQPREFHAVRAPWPPPPSAA